MLLRRRAMLGAGVESLEGKLGSVAVGKIVTINPVGDFILVHQGNPDKTIYDASCDGTWLLLKNSYTERIWDSRNNYADSNIVSYLSGAFDNLFTSTVSENILSVKIPYYDTTAETKRWLDEGFQCKSFLPAMVELGYNTEDSETDPNSYVPTDGTILEYFKGTATGFNDEDVKRECDARYWHRTPYTSTTDQIWTTSQAGRAAYRDGSYEYAVRPMIIMNKYTVIDGSSIIVSE